MRTDVILTTYNHPQWLRKVLWGFACQSDADFRVLVADDGSDQRTRKVIEEVGETTSLEIKHIWHEDNGFQKCRILNEAIAASDADYLIFTDGDCIPRRDFVAQHTEAARPGRFLSGGLVRLPMELSRAIVQEDIVSGRVHDPRWLVGQGVRSFVKLRMLAFGGSVARSLDLFTTTRATWNGANSSGWRKDLIAVNGYDERMGHGGLDRELGERLENDGIRGLQVRHRATCVHLDHDRGYAKPEILAENLKIREKTRRERATWTPYGMRKAASRESPVRIAA